MAMRTPSAEPAFAFAREASTYAVFARFVRSEPFSMGLFEGFDSLRVLTYSASIPATVQMVERFETVECVFGYEGVIGDLGTVLAVQRKLGEEIVAAVKKLEDEKRQLLLVRVAEGRARFWVARDQIAHSKIYLLEAPGHRRVITGSANLSLRAFSSRQAETFTVFDEDDGAWEHYVAEYELVRGAATDEFRLSDPEQDRIRLEELPVVQRTAGQEQVVLFVNTDPAERRESGIVHAVESAAVRLSPLIAPIVKPRAGRYDITRHTIGRIVQVVKNRRDDVEAREPTWLSIDRETGRVVLADGALEPPALPEDVRSDVECFLEYFGNFDRGFHGDVERHKRNFFTFMAWFYASPFVCDFRNRAILDGRYIFDYPQFGVLYGRSNCGKTCLIQTLMKSMFGRWELVGTDHFTRTNLRALIQAMRRFPIVFDDLSKRRFIGHGAELIKDETTVQDEYPAIALAMNAENQSFSSEIGKRCLLLYTNASIPDLAPETRPLYVSIRGIQDRLGTSLYREYLRRALGLLADDALPPDMLRFSSELIVDIFAKHAPESRLPDWCAPIDMDSYQGRKYEKVRVELRKLYENKPDIWTVKDDEVILALDIVDARAFQKEIPDYILGEGGKAGALILRRRPLEEFLETSFRRRWPRWLGRRRVSS